MTVSTFFLGLSVFGLLLSLATWFRVRIAAALLVPTFVVGWLRGELALQTIAIELLVTALFVGQGVHRDPLGRIGLGLTLASWALLAASHVRSVRAGSVLAGALTPIGIEPEGNVSLGAAHP